MSFGQIHFIYKPLGQERMYSRQGDGLATQYCIKYSKLLDMSQKPKPYISISLNDIFLFDGGGGKKGAGLEDISGMTKLLTSNQTP